MRAAVAIEPAHVIVLAAGRGSRLGSLGDPIPKWLLRVGGRTLADRHLEGIHAAAGAVASVSVVVGHAADAITTELAGREDDVHVVVNGDYETRNNWWSALLALRELPEDGPVAILNADLLINPDQVRAFLADGRFDGLLATDLERTVSDESMKVAVRPDGALDGIGKVGIDAPAGEYIGLLTARGETLRAFRAELERFACDPACAGEWYEAAIARTIARGAEWRVWPAASGRWVEIDDERDLRAAEHLEAAA